MMDSDGAQRVAFWVHLTLLAGVCLSGILLGLGLMLSFWHADASQVQTNARVPPAIDLKNLANGVGLMQIGLLILIATPMVRVLVLALGWSFSKNTRFAVVAWTVLALLMVGIFLGVSQ
jgi:uncharacterized membrane protein